MKIKLTEHTKETIRKQHQLINEDVVTRDQEKILANCGTQVGVKSLGNINKIPFPWVQFMIASGMQDDSMFKHMNSCGEAVKDIALGDDTDKAEKFITFVADKALDFKGCVEKKGLDLASLIGDEISASL